MCQKKNVESQNTTHNTRYDGFHNKHWSHNTHRLHAPTPLSALPYAALIPPFSIHKFHFKIKIKIKWKNREKGLTRENKGYCSTQETEQRSNFIAVDTWSRPKNYVFSYQLSSLSYITITKLTFFYFSFNTVKKHLCSM